MSRESDLAQLKELQQDIYDLYQMGDRFHTVSGKITTLANEKEHPKAPVYNMAPVNNYETLKKQYTDEWVKNHSSIKFFRILFLMLNAFAIIAIAIMFIADLFGNTGYILTPEKVKEFGDMNEIICIAIAHVLFSLVLIVVTFAMTGEES